MKLRLFPTVISSAAVVFILSSATFSSGQSVPTGQTSHLRRSLSPQKATAPPAPTPSAPSAITDVSFTANWSASPGATGYYLDVSSASSFGTYIGSFQNFSVGAGTSAAITGLTANTKYYFRVRAANSAGTSGNSATADATTLSVPPVAVPPAAAPAAPASTETYKKSLVDAAGCGTPSAVPSIPAAAVVAYQQVKSILASAPALDVVQKAAFNNVICDVASSVLIARPAKGRKQTDYIGAATKEANSQVAAANGTPQAYQKAVSDATGQIVNAVTEIDGRCKTQADTSDPNKTTYSYSYPVLAPLLGRGCSTQSVLNFYNVTGDIALATSVRYLYGVTASSNAISSDLVTGTFPLGFQAKLGTNVTTGASTNTTPSTSSGAGSTATTQSTDTPATAISKLEQGGDFYVEGLYPLLQGTSTDQGLSFISQLAPKVGFTVSGLGSQQTITQATDINFYYPVEGFLQLASISGTTDAVVIFADGQFGGEHISPDLAKKLNYGQNFFLGEMSFGLTFNSSVTVSAQYFVGPKGLLATSGATSTTANATGWHLSVELLPKSLGSSKAK